MMISTHGDGELITRVISYFGLKNIRGSSRRGAHGAYKAAFEIGESDANLCITPDGPKGPARKCHGGSVNLALKYDMPIIPVSYSASRCKKFNSWDKFMFVLPFSKLNVIAAEPIMPAEIKSKEQGNKLLEESLNKITDEVDALI